MRIIRTISSLQHLIKMIKTKKQSVGFVPTMGALHKGHLSLIRKSRRENTITVLSIFINPKQFGKGEDFSSYPRQEKNDILLAKKEMVDIIFYPSEEMMYPISFLTTVQVHKLSDHLCGISRPGHFSGVTTIVAKLLNIVQPDILYLGQKDAQQAVIIKQMICDLNFPVSVRIGSIIREADGLAVSSRNSKLTQQQRREAVILYQSLKEAKKAISNGEQSTAKILKMIQNKVNKAGSSRVEYVSCVHADSLLPLKRIQGKGMLLLAVSFGKVRLIDNMLFNAK